jgi:hypothetical protein
MANSFLGSIEASCYIHPELARPEPLRAVRLTGRLYVICEDPEAPVTRGPFVLQHQPCTGVNVTIDDFRPQRETETGKHRHSLKAELRLEPSTQLTHRALVDPTA